MKASKARKATSMPKGENSEPKWVVEMHRHYREFGTFRASDLRRVLGDPRSHVEVKSDGDAPVNHNWTRR